MIRQNFSANDGSGDYALPPSLQNVYLSPPQRLNHNAAENYYQSPTVPQPTNYNDRQNPRATPPLQNVVLSAYKHQLNKENHLTIDKDQGHKINVNLVDKGVKLGDAKLVLRIITPQNSNHGCKERLQILLTGQSRGK